MTSQQSVRVTEDESCTINLGFEGRADNMIDKYVRTDMSKKAG